jgi:hypothetical protein
MGDRGRKENQGRRRKEQRNSGDGGREETGRQKHERETGGKYEGK